MKAHLYKESQIPYGTLDKFGLTREMVEDLPQSVQDALLDGYRSPVLPIHITNDKGEEIHTRTRFSLVAIDGGVDVVFFPVLKHSPIERFSDEQRKRLQEGHAILAAMTTNDGREVEGFHQIDAETNQILSVPKPVIGRNLQALTDGINLTTAELVCLQKGLPVTIVDGEEMHTVGIDLNSKTGVRIAQGDERKWREQQRQGMEKYNFGINGCWMADDDGNLEYVPEEEYTDGMYEEMKKRVAARSAASIKH